MDDAFGANRVIEYLIGNNDQNVTRIRDDAAATLDLLAGDRNVFDSDRRCCSRVQRVAIIVLHYVIGFQ